MNIGVELLMLEQGGSCLCLLVALSRLAAPGRVPWGRLLVSSGLCGAASALLLMHGTTAVRAAGAVMMNLLAPLGALGQLPVARRLRAAELYLLLNLSLEGCARLLGGLGMPWLPAVAAASLLMLLLPRLRGTLRPLPVTRVEVRWHGRSVCLHALTDSGNLLRDPVTGLPVIVCSQQALAMLLPRMLPGMLPAGMRYLSVRTAAGGGLMPCFHPDSVRLLGARGWMEVQAMVGLTVDGYSGFQALVPAQLTREAAAHGAEGICRRESM